jgi:C-terminal processing protease CtpA/Prc
MAYRCFSKVRVFNAVTAAACLLAAPYSFGSPAFVSKPFSSDVARVERLVDLCKLWGAIKFFHPYLAYRDIDWDAALIKTLPKVSAAASSTEFKSAIDYLLSFLDDPATHTRNDPAGASKATPESAGLPQPYVRWVEDNIAVLVASDYGQFSGSAEKAGAFRKAFGEASRARIIIFDIRKRKGDGDDNATFWFNLNFSQAFPTLLDEPLQMASMRRRMHSGYATQTGQTSGGYYSAFVNEDGAVVAPQAQEGTRKPMIFLINDGETGIEQLLGGLQAAHFATVIQEGKRAPETAAGGYTMSLAGGLSVEVRTSEMLNPDGTVGFLPDLTTSDSPNAAPDASGDGAADTSPAMQMALGLARGTQAPPRATRLAATFLPSTKLDKSYAETPYPSREHRLLGLFRLWNIINYFYPYKHLFERPWDDVLREFIPKLEAAGDAEGYALAVAELVTNIHDTHCFIRSSALDKYFGTHVPPIEVKSIEGQTIVTHIFDEALRASSRVQVGDVILSVDGEDIAKRRDRLGRYIAASTPQALRWRVHQKLLAGAENSKVRLEVRDQEGRAGEVSLTRNMRLIRTERQTPVFGILPSGFGYMDLERLTIGQVDSAFAAIKDTSAVIMDMRGYPKGTAWSIAPWLASKPFVAALFQRPAPESPDPDQNVTVKFPQGGVPRANGHYAGKVVVLINEEAISQSEHTCLFLEAAGNATFIGTPTNGANGDVTTAVLPGGIYVNFSGHDVRHGDGRQLQRVGIQPHFQVEPTIAGIRSGRDEVLDRAIEFLEKSGKH